MSNQPDIIYTKVDEAPELASGSFLPIIKSFAKAAGINVGTKDISLAGRIISQFPDCQGQSKNVPVWRSKSVPLGLKNIGY
ncbi:MAG: monomeric isocitrate dehydrogenase [Nitrospinales bacterium]|jgi:monomeric isocitrate dehydrogenase